MKLFLILLLPFLFGFTFIDTSMDDIIILQTNTTYTITYESFYRNLEFIKLGLYGNCSGVILELYENGELISVTDENYFDLYLDSKGKKYEIVVNVTLPDEIFIDLLSNDTIAFASSLEDLILVNITKINTTCALGITNEENHKISNITFYQNVFYENYSNVYPEITIIHNITKTSKFRDDITYFRWGNHGFRRAYERYKFTLGIYLALFLLFVLGSFYYGMRKMLEVLVFISVPYYFIQRLFLFVVPMPYVMLLPLILVLLGLYFIIEHKKLIKMLRK
jgi:hypothetical protein